MHPSRAVEPLTWHDGLVSMDTLGAHPLPLPF